MIEIELGPCTVQADCSRLHIAEMSEADKDCIKKIFDQIRRASRKLKLKSLGKFLVLDDCNHSITFAHQPTEKTALGKICTPGVVTIMNIKAL